jgi:hypothetical protein
MPSYQLLMDNLGRQWLVKPGCTFRYHTILQKQSSITTSTVEDGLEAHRAPSTFSVWTMDDGIGDAGLCTSYW